MSADLVRYTLEGATALVQMDDGKANALSEAMIAGLVDALARAEKEANALVLAGRAERFCAGFDLRVMMSGLDAAKGLLTRGADLLMKLYGSPLPIVVACTGHAMAGGALVLLTADVRIGAEGAFRIGLNEVSIGMPVPILAMELARDRIATRALTRTTLFASIYDPRGAADVGFLDEVLPPADVVARAKEEATRLGALSRAAYHASKTRLRRRTIEHILETLEGDMAALTPPGAG
jgi:enoyl-CoA hydratase